MSTNLATTVPLVNVPFTSNGYITEAWFMFLVQLFRRTGGNTPSGNLTIADVLALEETFANPTPSLSGNALETTFAPIKDANKMLDMTFAHPASTSYAQNALAVTLGASPATYTASFPQGFYISGGTITSFSIQRGSIVLPIGNSASDIIDATPAFLAGSSSSVTLPDSFGSVSRLWVFFDGVFQGDDQISSLVGTTLTFTSSIPVGVHKVYVKGLLQSAVGIGSTLVELSIGDTVNVTYSGSPSVTILPR
jgi:hypothetical protein